jgi:hypothetical protein
LPADGNWSEYGMSEKDKTGQGPASGNPKPPVAEDSGGQRIEKQSREDRLAEALRANLRRRKSAARRAKAD